MTESMKKPRRNPHLYRAVQAVLHAFNDGKDLEIVFKETTKRYRVSPHKLWWQLLLHTV
jgi:hypothetical protein